MAAVMPFGGAGGGGLPPPGPPGGGPPWPPCLADLVRGYSVRKKKRKQGKKRPEGFRDDGEWAAACGVQVVPACQKCEEGQCFMLVDRANCGRCIVTKQPCSYNLGTFATDHDRLVQAGLLEPPPLTTAIYSPDPVPAPGVGGAAGVGGGAGPVAARAGPVPGTAEYWAQYAMYAAAAAAVGVPPVAPQMGPPAVPGAMAGGFGPMGVAPPVAPGFFGAQIVRPPVAPPAQAPQAPVAPPARPPARPPAPPPIRPPAAGGGQDGPGGPMRRGRATLQEERNRANTAEANLRAAQRQLREGAVRAQESHAAAERNLARVHGYAQRLYERLASGAGPGVNDGGRTARDEIGDFADAFEQVADGTDRLRAAADPAVATEGWLQHRRDVRRQRREEWEDRDRRSGRPNRPGRGGHGEGGSAPGGSGGAA